MDLRIINDFEKKAQIYFDKTSSHRFRESDDLTIVFAYNHFVLENKHLARVNPRTWAMRNVIDVALKNTMIVNRLAIILLKFLKPAIFCINDDVSNDDLVEGIWQLVHDFFQSSFPNPSQCEL
jgi:hypothetical protein